MLSYKFIVRLIESPFREVMEARKMEVTQNGDLVFKDNSDETIKTFCKGSWKECIKDEMVIE